MTGLGRRRSGSDGELRTAAIGLGWAGLGTLIALVAGVGLDLISPLTDDLLYQQVHFTIFYLGFALLLHGIEALAWPTAASSSSRRLRWLGRGAFGLAVAVAAVYLYDPASYRVSGHHVAQQGVFYLPLVVVLVLGASVPTAMAFARPSERALRTARLWFATFATLALVGMLRESTLLPSSGEPMVDLLLAFGPFALSGVCLLLSVRSLRAPLSVPMRQASG